MQNAAVALLNEHYRKTADIIVKSGEVAHTASLAAAAPRAPRAGRRPK